MDFRGRQAIFFITILCGVMNSEPARPNAVMYFKLALQWPGAFRYPYRCPCKVSEDFYIHGLWKESPASKWKEPPANQCSRHRLNLPEGDLGEKMKSMWRSLIGECNDTWLWEHEWQKHGYFSNLEQLDYFNKTIKLREEVNPLGVLVRKKIYPSSCPYSIDRIRKALQEIRGFAEIACYERDVLSEIRFCVDPTDYSFMECPKEMKESGECRTKIYFLPCDDSWYSPPYNSGTTSGSRTALPKGKCPQPSPQDVILKYRR